MIKLIDWKQHMTNFGVIILQFYRSTEIKKKIIFIAPGDFQLNRFIITLFILVL